MAKPPKMKLPYAIGWRSARTIRRYYFGSEVLHEERVPKEGPLIVAANHASFFDPFAVGSATRRELFYLARSTAFWFPLGTCLRAMNAVPVEREGGGLKGMLQIIDLIGEGKAVTLFPEGTRSSDGQIKPPKAGIGLIVIKSGAPVLPVRIFGAYQAWNRHMTFPRPGRKLTIKFAKPLDFSELRQEAQSCSKNRLKEIYLHVADKIMATIIGLEPVPDV